MENTDGLMRTKIDHSGCWPNRNQELLLQAGLMRGTKAVDAWKQWKRNVDLDNVDAGSNRLFPLLFSNLRLHHIEDPLVKIFEWVYIANHAKTLRILQEMSYLLRAFQDAGIRTMILKGAALTSLHYKDYGLRPMGDFDVLVPTKQAKQAIRMLHQQGWLPMETALKGFARIGLLKKFGWEPKPRFIESFTDVYFAVRHAHEFLDTKGHVCDLHWHLLHGCSNPEADGEFWDKAVAIQFCGVPTHALNPTDQLFHACIYGVKWDVIAPVRWVADAFIIMDSPDNEIDWERLVFLARLADCVLPLKAALTYLQLLLDVAVPSHILRELKNLPVSYQKGMEYKIRVRPPRVVDGLLEVYLVSRCCFKQMKDKNLIQKMVALPRLLQHVFGMDHIGQLIFYVIFELVRRTGKMLQVERPTPSR